MPKYVNMSNWKQYSAIRFTKRRNFARQSDLRPIPYKNLKITSKGFARVSKERVTKAEQTEKANWKMEAFVLIIWHLEQEIEFRRENR